MKKLINWAIDVLIVMAVVMILYCTTIKTEYQFDRFKTVDNLILRTIETKTDIFGNTWVSDFNLEKLI